ncbi:MAG: M20/M25/M40 family metallo-hydrolase [Vicinamibacterales bacterium]
MKCRFLSFSALALFAFVPLHISANDAAVLEAQLAWDRGEYVAALTGYLKLLTDSPDDSTFESIALQTGELYSTTELTSDGSAPRFSPDGRTITFETGTGLKKTVRLVAAESPRTVRTELPGFSARFSPEGAQLVYLRVTLTRELEQEQAAIDAAPASERSQRLGGLTQSLTAASQIVVRDLASGRERTVAAGELRKSAPMMAAEGMVLFAGGAGSEPTQIYGASPSGAPKPLTTDPGEKALIDVNSKGTAALVGVRTGGGGRGGRGGGFGGPQTFGLLTLPSGSWTPIEGTAPTFSADGRYFAYVSHAGGEFRVMAADVTSPTSATVVVKGPDRLDAPALSRDGSLIAFQRMPREDWELFVVNREGTGERRVTREIQHDLLPRFLTNDRLLGVMGEPRHRRSYIYDLPSSESAPIARKRLFHNNTVRTIAPEYLWVPSADGTRVLISAERDGDTVSAERGVYLVDLSRRVTRDELRARVIANLTTEQALVQKGQRLYLPIASSVHSVVNDASLQRVFAYEKALYEFDSKHVSQPGNKLASQYLFDTYKSFGYEPQFQWFEARGALDGQSANVIATLKGTVNSELVYVVSSHYDSVSGGPGADDDSSGTAALLEAARILAKHPQPATIVFASFTGEESGLLGSREFVRRAVAGKLNIVGALNNDMIGWANDHRLDNTIRYSNPGIRDIQHAAAMQFTKLITYDALYYKGTDAAAYYDAYGDIVGGIGSYPVLGNPHYHQPHDVLETINHQLVTEVAKTTAATLMLLASSPSRLTNLKIESYLKGTARVSWRPAPESGVTGYLVAYGPPDKPEAQQFTMKSPSATVQGPPGTVVSVKAVNARGLEGWDWARVTIR